MKCYLYILFTIIFTTNYTQSQTKSVLKDSITPIEEDINHKLSKAINLYSNFDYNKALTTAILCFKKSDSIKNDSLLGKSYIIIGIINSGLGKKNQAILNHRKAEAIFIKTKNYKHLGDVYNNIGVAYAFSNKKIDTTRATNQKEIDSIKNYYQKNIDSVIKYYTKALNTYISAKSHANIANSFYNLGITYSNTGDYVNAELMLKKALNSSKIHNKSSITNSSICYTYSAYSKLYLRMNSFSKALKYANLAENLAIKNKHNDILVHIYKTKSEILDTLGNFSLSYSYLKLHNDLLKKVHENEKSKLTFEELAKFEAKEQIVLLEKEKLENSINKNRLEKTKQLINLTIVLLIISILVAFLLKKNNLLKLENNKLLKIKNKKLKELQLKTELNFLKTQIQPHFFFNTLNNLYALIIEKSEKAKDVVIKLSKLMKYTMYGTKNITVPIIDEINNIKNYLELESLRYGKKAYPNIEIEGEMDNVVVPPMLFTTFIENSFKHNDVRDEDFNLEISFTATKSKYLYFKVQNTLIAPTENRKEKIKGIGIENVKRRLMLIYKNDYQLRISTKRNSHHVHLKIPISHQE